MPDGVKVIGEWAGSGRVVRVFDTDDQQALMAGILAWNDLMSMETFPVLGTEEIMEVTKKQ